MPGQVDRVLSFSLIEILLFRLIVLSVFQLAGGEFLFQPDRVSYLAV